MGFEKYYEGPAGGPGRQRKASITERLLFGGNNADKDHAKVIENNLGPRSAEALRRLSVSALATRHTPKVDPDDVGRARQKLKDTADNPVSVVPVTGASKSIQKEQGSSSGPDSEHDQAAERLSRNMTNPEQQLPRKQSQDVDDHHFLRFQPSSHSMTIKEGGNMWKTKLGGLFSHENGGVKFNEAYKKVVSIHARESTLSPSVAVQHVQYVKNSMGPRSSETLKRISLIANQGKAHQQAKEIPEGNTED